MSQGSYSGGGSSWDNNSNLPPSQSNMSLQLPMTYDSRRLFPFGLSPIPEVPSELASEVSSIASYSPTPSLDDSDTEVESVRSRGSIMYSGSCDSIKSNRTLHGKSSDSESSTESDHDTNEEDEETEEECCGEYHLDSIPSDTPGPDRIIQINSTVNEPIEVEHRQDGTTCSQHPETLYNSQVTQVMHQRTFLNSPEQTHISQEEVFIDDKKSTQFLLETPSHKTGLDMVSGAATASEIFRHLQATRGKQEVTTELAKILNVLKTTLTTDVKDSSSSEDESPAQRMPETKIRDPGKPPRAPQKMRTKTRSSISPAILSRINELENAKPGNPKEEMNLLSKILVHLLCSCKSTAASEELKRIIRQFKEVAKAAMEEGEHNGDFITSNNRSGSRNSIRKVRSRTASGNSNNSGHSETDSLNTLTPGNTDSKSSETDDETGQDTNKSRLRFNIAVTSSQPTETEPCVSYTLTLPCKKSELVPSIDTVTTTNENKTAQENVEDDDEEWEWEYEDELGQKSATPNSKRDSESDCMSPSEAKSDTSTGSTNKILTEMEMGAYNSGSTSHSDHGNSQSTPITEEDDALTDHAETDDEMKKNEKRKRRGSEKGEINGHLFCHLEETFKVLSDTYKIITTGSSPDSSEALHNIDKSSDDNIPGKSFEDILDGVSTQCVQLESEILRSSRHSTATPEIPRTQLNIVNNQFRPNSKCASKISRPGSRMRHKTPLPDGEAIQDCGDDDDEWEYYYEEDETQPNGVSYSPSCQLGPNSRTNNSTTAQNGQVTEIKTSNKATSRQEAMDTQGMPLQIHSEDSTEDRVPSRAASKQKYENEDEEDWGDEDEWEYYYEDDEQQANDPSRPPSRQIRPSSRATSRSISQQGNVTEVRVSSRAASRQEVIDAHGVQSQVQSRDGIEIRVPSRAIAKQELIDHQRAPSRGQSRQAGDHQRIPSRLSSRPSSRTSSRMKVVKGGDEDCDEDEWEYYYEEDYPEEESADTMPPKGSSHAPSCQVRPGSKAMSSSISQQAPGIEIMTLSRASSRQEVPDANRVPSRIQTKDGIEVRVPSKTASKKELMDHQRVPSRMKSSQGGEEQRITSRIYSRPSSRTSSRMKTREGIDEECEEDEWEYYYEEDYPEKECTDIHNPATDMKEATPTASSTPAPIESDNAKLKPNGSPPEKTKAPSRPNSRQTSRPNSRSSSCPVTRNSSRMKGTTSSLRNLDEEDDWYYDDGEDIELSRLSPTATTAPTTRATSPFPDEKGIVEPNRGTGFSQRKISTIIEEQSPIPSAVKTPTYDWNTHYKEDTGSTTPKVILDPAKMKQTKSSVSIRNTPGFEWKIGDESNDIDSNETENNKTPSNFISGDVGYLNSMAGVSVALAAEYLGQDTQKLVASLPAEFIEENQVLVKEKKKKKHYKNPSKTKSAEYENEESDEKKKRRKKKKGDGKFLPKIGVRDLVNKLEPQLFQDTQVGTKMVISRDEARDVIRESKKKTPQNDTFQDAYSQKNISSKDQDVEKRKSVREMVQLMSSQIPVNEDLEEIQQLDPMDVRKSNHPNFNIPSISVSSNAPPVPPPPQGYYSNHNQYPQQYQQFPQQCTPQYVQPNYQQGPQSPYQQYPPQQQYQQYQQLYQSYQPYPPPPPPQQYQQYPRQYQQQQQQYPQQNPSYATGHLPYTQQQMVYQSESNPTQMKVVSSGGQTTVVNMRQKSTGNKQKESRGKYNKSTENIQYSPEDSEAYGTGSTGSESQDGGIDHEDTGEQESGAKPHKRHSRLFKLLQDSDYTDSDTDSRNDFSRISMKNVEDNHGRESDMDSICSGIERKHSFRSHKSSNKESDNESVASSGIERKISPSSMQKNLATRRFMQLNLQSCYEPSSSELSTPNSPTAAGPDIDRRRRSTSKQPARVFNYLPDEFDNHAAISDDSSYQSLQSLNSFDSFVDSVAGHEVEEILKRKVSRDNLYRYQTDSPSAYVRASPKSVELLRGSPKRGSPKLDTYNRASPKLEQELMELTNFPSSPCLTLRQLHGHRGFYGGSK